MESATPAYEGMRNVRSPPYGLNDSTWYPAFFIPPAMNPRTVCRCQPIEVMISDSVAPSSRGSMATTWAVLLLSRGGLASCDLGALVAPLRDVVFFAAGASSGAASGVCGATGVADADGEPERVRRLERPQGQPARGLEALSICG
jgi:hypothetical protein